MATPSPSRARAHTLTPHPVPSLPTPTTRTRSVNCVYMCGVVYRTPLKKYDLEEWTKTLRRVNAHESKRCRRRPVELSASGVGNPKVAIEYIAQRRAVEAVPAGIPPSLPGFGGDADLLSIIVPLPLAPGSAMVSASAAMMPQHASATDISPANVLRATRMKVDRASKGGSYDARSAIDGSLPLTDPVNERIAVQMAHAQSAALASVVMLRGLKGGPQRDQLLRNMHAGWLATGAEGSGGLGSGGLEGMPALNRMAPEGHGSSAWTHLPVAGALTTTAPVASASASLSLPASAPAVASSSASAAASASASSSATMSTAAALLQSQQLQLQLQLQSRSPPLPLPSLASLLPPPRGQGGNDSFLEKALKMVEGSPGKQKKPNES